MTSTSDKVIYLDMDGVLCDFMEGFLNAHGRDDLMDKLKAEEWPMTWDFGGEFGEQDNWWPKIDAMGELFWEYLNTYWWTNKILMEIGATGIPWYVCTTPRLTKNCLAGKLTWLNHMLGEGNFDLIQVKDKWRLAHEKALLIDDNDKNCIKFHKAGGQTCLFPQTWNENRDLINHRTTYFQHCLETFASEVTLANV
jgi:5'(3')-deoxyribonucleotidase